MVHDSTLGNVELLTLRYGYQDIDRIYSSRPFMLALAVENSRQ